MNKVAIITGICGLVIGAAGGYSVCHFMEKKKIDQKVSDEVQKTLDEIIGHQKEKIMENEEKKSNIINAIPHFTAIDIAKDIVVENGYTSTKEDKKEEEVKEPEDEPDSELPFDMPIEKHNIWDENDMEKDADILEKSREWADQDEYQNKADSEEAEALANSIDISKPPYPITKEQYDEDFTDSASEGVWDKVSLIFFTDNVFAERDSYNEFTTMSSTEVDIAIGKDNVKKFIEDRSLGRVFVRNNKLRIDYEIVRSPRSYSSVLHEEEE